MRSHGQHLPRLLLLAILITLITALSSSASALYWRTEFYPCKDRRDDIGVSVTMLYCDMYKFTKAGFKCNDVHCEAPKSNCVKNIAKDPIEQAKAYLTLTGACQGLNNARYEKVEYELDNYHSRPGARTVITSVLRQQRCLFAVQDKASVSTD
ncbi:hypothetical protein BGZ95_004666 [Linnemannia exigua]|uniref:Secreted protein n=1 Tax=Linnemannia exigua TaxID=604196 RepID=A0AAD4D2S2_9FUNG|nr:hypothetical protein BGZ95_004666 [Linnemannia exigua]